MNRDNLDPLKDSEEVLESQVLGFNRDLVNSNLQSLIEMKSNLLKEYDRNTVRIASYLLEPGKAKDGEESPMSLLSVRLEAHNMHFLALNRLIDLVAFSILEEDSPGLVDALEEGLDNNEENER